MKFSLIVSAALAATLFAAVPASAQYNSMSGSSMSNSNATANGNAMSTGTSGSGNANMSCQAMMAKADAMTQPTDLTKKSAAQKDMAEAKSARAAGNEASCKMHVQAAIRNML